MAERIDYACSECGARDCKLWRPAHDTEPLRCARCALAWVGLPLSDMDEHGKTLTRFSDGVDRGRSDQLFNAETWRSLVPAVPDERREHFYGYTSVPEDGCAWWRYLPTFPEVTGG